MIELYASIASSATVSICREIRNEKDEGEGRVLTVSSCDRISTIAAMGSGGYVHFH
jgi:hypothetical protein